MYSQKQSSREITLRTGVLYGALQGLIAWTIYAIVECFFSTTLSWIIRPSHDYIPLHWGFVSLLLFVVYPAVGSILGGLSGLCFKIANLNNFDKKILQSKIFFPAFSIFLLILAYDINFIFNRSQPLGLSELPVLSVSVLLVLTLVLTARSNIWFNRLRFFTNPWTVSLLLLGLPWIHRELLDPYSTITEIGASLAYFIVIVSISFIIQKMVPKIRIGETEVALSQSWKMNFAILACAVFTVLGISLFLHQEPLVETKDNMSSSQNDGRPNVIMIVMDTVRADHLSLYGYERDTTPNLKKFSEESTLYTRAIAPGNMTLSTHASIFTGLSPSQHGAFYALPDHPKGRPLAEEFQTLAEVLSERGYFTIGVVANNTFLSNNFRLNQGFQYYDYRTRVTLLPRVPCFFLSKIVILKIKSFLPPKESLLIFRRAENINIEVFTHLDRLSISNNPFFLFINYMDAHWPYLPPHPFDKLYPGKVEGLPNFSHSLKMRNEVLKCQRKPTEKERNHRISQYDGGICYVDFHIGKLIKRLKLLSLYKDSLIIITSDHGEAFGERYLMEHATSVYEDQVHVPLIIKCPNITKKRVVNKPFSIVDLAKFTLDLLQIQIVDEGGQASNSVKYLIGSRDSKIIFSEHFPAGWLFNTHHRFQSVERAIYSESFKLISSTAGKRELYDLQKDPGEKKNLYKPSNPISEELEKKLDSWIESVKKEPESSQRLDKNIIDNLKTLGYIQ